MAKEAKQIDRMIDEGLGGGVIEDELDKKQLENPISKKKKTDNDKENTMTRNLDDVKKLGKEMEAMKTNQEVRESGKVPSPTQDEVELEDKDK